MNGDEERKKEKKKGIGYSLYRKYLAVAAPPPKGSDDNAEEMNRNTEKNSVLTV